MPYNWNNWIINEELKTLLRRSPKVIVPENREELINMSLGGPGNDYFEVTYNYKDIGENTEAYIVRCKNGIAVNYTDPYMRRRDPDCMLVNNFSQTDKLRYEEKYDIPFDQIRKETLEWLSSNELILLPFMAGGNDLNYPALLLAPSNAAFFALGLADLQGLLDITSIKEYFQPKAVIYLAPPFRHKYFDGKQIVVHNSHEEIYELFSYNLYPGPSAKKGVYGLLLSLGVQEGWVTVHGSTVKVITPYDNEITFLHEGASGSGKSEMLEYPHREKDGRLLLGKNIYSYDTKYLTLSQSCKLHPVTDDMALCHPKFQNNKGKLVVTDAEKGWFVRVNHITNYGTDPYMENLTIHPRKPLIFLNFSAQPQSTCLLWEHIEDKPGKRCPNPRVIIPRDIVDNVLNDPVEIEFRSFGIRTPPCSRETPSYGIFGLFHLLPPALAWLWRLVAPRGFSNPSIIDTEGLASEGVGSYWPFATGRQVDHANLLLEQIASTPDTRYILIPNQYIGVWNVGFMGQWIVREYLARRGQASFSGEKIKPARSVLAGYVVKAMQFEGAMVADKFLEVNKQPEVGNEGYDKGSEMLYEFFEKELTPFLSPDLNPLGKKIIQCCLNNGSIENYEDLIPPKY